MLDYKKRHEQNDFALCIIALSASYDMSITSWIRTTKHNAMLPGSVKDSRHLEGLACDVVLDDVSKTGEFIKDCESVRLQAIDEKTHIHVQVPR